MAFSRKRWYAVGIYWKLSAYLVSRSLNSAHRRDSTKKESALLKLIAPIFTLVCYLLLIYLVASAPAEALTYLMEAGIVGLLVLFIRFFYLRKFSAARYSFKPPRVSVLLGVLLPVPLWVVVKHRLIYVLFSLGDCPEVQIGPFYAEEPLPAGLISCLSGVILAPIIEEPVFRYIPPTAGRSKIAFWPCCSTVWCSPPSISGAFTVPCSPPWPAALFLLTKNITCSTAQGTSSSFSWPTCPRRG